MNKKLLSGLTMITALIIIFLLIAPSTVNAAFNISGTQNKLTSIIEMAKKRYEDVNKYTSFLSELKGFAESADINVSSDEFKVQIIDKVSELQKKYGDTAAISNISTQIVNKVMTSESSSASGILQTIIPTITSLMGNTNITIQSLIPDVEVNDMVATTAGKLVGAEYKVKLAGKIFFAGIDANGNPKSDKWVVLVHGFNMNGQAMADAVGQMYLDQGFNVLAPDSRGFGSSEGSNGMGYLESLDTWDWLTYINSNYSTKCNEIIVHGISLGGATTVFLSGLEVDGKTLKDQNVIGLVEDCGYRSMTGIVNDLVTSGKEDGLIAKILGLVDIKTLLMEKAGVGLTEENFDTLENALNSLKKCSLPLLIIHGTKDIIVRPENSTAIYNTAIQNPNIPYVQRFMAEGENHAFIVLGTKYNVYEGHVQNFIKQAESIAIGNSVEKESTYQEEKEEKTSLITGLIKSLKLIKNMLGK